MAEQLLDTTKYKELIEVSIEEVDVFTAQERATLSQFLLSKVGVKACRAVAFDAAALKLSIGDAEFADPQVLSRAIRAQGMVLGMQMALDSIFTQVNGEYNPESEEN